MPVASEYSRRRPPPSSLQLVPVTRIEKFSGRTGRSQHTAKNMSKMLGDESEVVFDQPEATEPYHGARPRTTEFDWPVDE